MDIFDNIARLLAGGESLALATIVSRSGSAPRAVGSRMAIRPGGDGIGTIGGGILEARVQEAAREVFGHGQSVLKEYRLTARDAGRMGMVCGGMVQILVQFLDAAGTGNLELYREIAASSGTGKPSVLITQIPSDFDVPGPILQTLIKGGGTIIGDLDQEAVAITARAAATRPELVSHQGKQYLVETLAPAGTVYIFGAGHIARQLAPLTKRVGFCTVVLDDRLEFASRERFSDADEVIALDSFQAALERLEINADSYLVLITRGHAHDQTVLRQALMTEAGYIGMIGSRRKREAIYAALAQEGFSRMDFDRVFSPIGFAIGAETPEEIAVSIAAELIRIRAEKRGR
ncbi:MAG: XdhC/CoxI family protein [Deltaproteobacteria bacterium]|nr:MAG: XdhC/CoxI family protein [Deltaproteobacteria bacterium]